MEESPVSSRPGSPTFHDAGINLMGSGELAVHQTSLLLHSCDDIPTPASNLGGNLDLASLSTASMGTTLSLEPLPEIQMETKEEEEKNGTIEISVPVDDMRSHIFSFSSLQRMNTQKDQCTERIVSYIEKELEQLQENEKNDVSLIISAHKAKIQTLKKKRRDLKKLQEHNHLLSKQLDELYSENTMLRDNVSTIEKKLCEGGNEEIISLFQEIKGKLWGDAIHIGKEKEKRVKLLKRLSQTRFKSSNERHCALLNRLWEIHLASKSDASWKDIGFETDSPGDELGKTGILGLQNLVYFSDRYAYTAKLRSQTKDYKWALTGISITGLVVSLLYQHGGKGCFSDTAPNVIFKTFINLMDHSKAFEELYCVCFMIYDVYVGKAESPEDAYEKTSQKLTQLLQTKPLDLNQLNQNAKCLLNSFVS